MIWPTRNSSEPKASHRNTMESTTSPTTLDATTASDQPSARERRIDREIGKLRQQEGGRRGHAPVSAARARPTDAAPTMIAPMPNSTPSRRCTRSRNTSARPIISTPEGAMMPGATGIRHGPCGTQTVPTWPISQLAAGMVRQNSDEKDDALDSPAPVVLVHRLPSQPKTSQSRRRAARRPGSRRSRSPSRAACVRSPR